MNYKFYENDTVIDKDGREGVIIKSAYSVSSDLHYITVKFNKPNCCNIYQYVLYEIYDSKQFNVGNKVGLVNCNGFSYELEHEFKRIGNYCFNMTEQYK